MVVSTCLQCACLVLAIAGAGAEEGQCGFETRTSAADNSWKGPGRIIDITKELHAETLHWDSPHGLGDFRDRYAKIEEGDLANQSQLKDFPVHVATHVDAPGHFVHERYETGKGVEDLDLYMLNGPALVIDVPFETNITAAALEELHIPPGVKRILFKTLNTQQGLMHKTAFDTSYTSVTEDGAQWILDNTEIGLVGIDYTSVAIYEDLLGPHRLFLPAAGPSEVLQGIIPLEGLVLDDVPAGLYDLHCLPLLITGSDGAPTRCILIT